LPDVGKKMEYMLNTGNLVSKTGLDISQATGFTVVAEKLNFFRFTPPSPCSCLAAQAECSLLLGVILLFVHTFKHLLARCVACAGSMKAGCSLMMKL